MHPYAAQQLALSLLHLHGLSDWHFRFDHARRRFGSCRAGRKLITLSRSLVILNDESEVRDTLLHEIAHALSPGDGHGRLWRAACRRIGARPVRCYSDDAVVSPPRKAARYRFGCRACGWSVERRRLTRRAFVCAKCRGPLHYEDRAAGKVLRIDNRRVVELSLDNPRSTG